MELSTISIEKTDTMNIVLGQAQSVRTIEDMHEALSSTVVQVGFGIAFCEASGQRLVRCVGTDETLLELAKKNAALIGAGDIFLVLFAQTPDPREILAAIKSVSGVTRIYCATANATEVVVASTQ